jgi:hypothetical protein
MILTSQNIHSVANFHKYLNVFTKKNSESLNQTTIEIVNYNLNSI